MRTPLTDHPDAPLYDSFSQIHRAVVQYSSTTTGEIQVVIPSVTGIYTTVPISYYGREAHPFENDWVVPNVGDTIIVCREDEDYTNVFWINTTYNPVRADVGEVNPTEYGFGPDGQTGSGTGFSLMSVTPSSAGLYLSDTHMGFYSSTDSAWRTYMDTDGNFYLTGSSGATHGLTWTADANTLAITGTITLAGSSSALVESEITNPDDYTFGPGLAQTLASISSHPSSAGLFLGANYMGYHTGNSAASGWRSYMDSSGNFGLTAGGTHSLSWSSSAGTLDIAGDITIRNQGAVRGQLNVADGAEPNTSAQDNPSDYSFGGDATFTLNTLPSSITTAGLYLGYDSLGYHDGSTWKTYMDSSGKFYLGGTSGSLQWDGSTLTILGTAVIGGTAASTVVSGAASGASAVQDGDGSLNLTLTDGAVGGWVITTGLLTGGTESHKIELDQGNKRISAGGGRAVMLAESSGRVAIGIDASADNAPVYNSSDGDVVMERTSGGTARFSCGNKLTWDGSTLSVTGNGTFSGSLSGANITGATGTFSGSLEVGTNNEFAVASDGQLDLGPNGATKFRVKPSVSSNFIFQSAAAVEFHENNTVYGYLQGDSQNINLFGGSATITGVLMGSSTNYVGAFKAWSGKSYGVVLTAVASGQDKILLNATKGVESSSQSGTPPTTDTLYNHSGTLKWNGSALSTSTYTFSSPLSESSGTVSIDLSSYMQYWMLQGDGSTTSQIGPGNETVHIVGGTNMNATLSGNYVTVSHESGNGKNHIPTGGSSGQVLKYSSAGTAVWGTDNKWAVGKCGCSDVFI